MVGETIRADAAGPVYRENHGKLLQAHVMLYLVYRTLKERGVYGDDGLHSRLAQLAKQRYHKGTDCVLFVVPKEEYDAETDQIV